MLWSTLTLTSKVYLAFGCSLVLAVSLVFVVCFLLPDHWSLCPTQGSDYDPRQDAFADDNLVISRRQAEKYVSTCEDGTEREDRVLSGENHEKTARASTSSSVLSTDSGRPSSSGVGSGSSVISEISPASSRRTSLLANAPLDNHPPRIHLTIQRNDHPAESKQQFTLIIEKATELPRRTYVDTLDPTVIVRLERNRSRTSGFVSSLIGRASFRSPSENELLALDASCPVAYHCRSPAFKHRVQLDVPGHVRIEECQLVLRVEDRDKLVGTGEICSCRIDLQEVADSFRDGEDSVSLTRDLRRGGKEKKIGKGDVLLGLSFLPTSQRVTVRVTQFERLPKSSDVGLAIVRLFVLNEAGRVIKKRKTAPRPYSMDGRLEFDEQFAIELDVDRWQRSVLLIVLSRIVELERAESGRAPPVYEHVGHVAVGRTVACVDERIHWNSALQMPRRVVSQWHRLH